MIKVVKDRKERLINSYLLLYWVWGLGLEDHCWAFRSMSRLDYTNVRVGFMPKLVNAVCCVEMNQLVWCLYSDDAVQKHGSFMCQVRSGEGRGKEKRMHVRVCFSRK